jgi:hypothetical protein
MSSRTPRCTARRICADGRLTRDQLPNFSVVGPEGRPAATLGRAVEGHGIGITRAETKVPSANR